MKYIDADLLREKIEFWKSCLPTPDGFANKAKYEAMGARDSLNMVLYFLDSLPEQPVDGLEKEIDSCWQNWLSPSNQKEVEGVLPKTEFATYARHFAEWGRKQVLQEIYDGKVKPVDKITAAWLDDEQST